MFLGDAITAWSVKLDFVTIISAFKLARSWNTRACIGAAASASQTA